MNPATIIILSLLLIYIITKIIGCITNKPKNIVVLTGKNDERKKDADFVDDVVLLDMVDEETDYTTFELTE